VSDRIGDGAFVRDHENGRMLVSVVTHDLQSVGSLADDGMFKACSRPRSEHSEDVSDDSPPAGSALDLVAERFERCRSRRARSPRAEVMKSRR